MRGLRDRTGVFVSGGESSSGVDMLGLSALDKIR